MFFIILISQQILLQYFFQLSDFHSVMLLIFEIETLIHSEYLTLIFIFIFFYDSRIIRLIQWLILSFSVALLLLFSACCWSLLNHLHPFFRQWFATIIRFVWQIHSFIFGQFNSLSITFSTWRNSHTSIDSVLWKSFIIFSFNYSPTNEIG